MLQFSSSLDEVTARVKKLDGLQIALRTQPHSFVARFLEVRSHPSRLGWADFITEAGSFVRYEQSFFL